jgi:excinuclease UvrABC nuclease subunit
MNTLDDIINLPSVSFSWRADLPSIGGIYFVVHDILSPALHYVGQAQNIRQRWQGHENKT